MSAFQVPAVHIGAIVRFAVNGPQHRSRPYWKGSPLYIHDDRAADIMRELATENARSMTYRYPDDPCEPVTFDDNVFAYPALSPAQCLQAIDCLEYQSCEHPEWDQSDAVKFLRSLYKIAVHALPEWEAANCWPISDEKVKRNCVERATR